MVFFAVPVFAQDFTINRFHADIAVNEDSSFLVKETIDVEFHQSKHGIYREIPFKYVDDLGNKIKTPLDVLSVTDSTGRNGNIRSKEGRCCLYKNRGPENLC